MKIQITDPVNETIVPKLYDFDAEWEEMGRNIKFMLQTYDPNTTWLNLYLSHDGKPSFQRTIQRIDNDPIPSGNA